MKSLRIWTIVWLLIGASLEVSVFAQGRVDDSFASMPPEVRTRLSERVNQYLEYLHNQEWDKIYGLYWAQYVAGVNGLHGVTKEQYVEEKKRLEREGRGSSLVNLMKFRSTQTRLLTSPTDEVVVAIVEGCGEYRPFWGRDKNLKSAVMAAYDKGEWWLEDIAVHRTCTDCPLEECKVE